MDVLNCYLFIIIVDFGKATELYTWLKDLGNGRNHTPWQRYHKAISFLY